MEIPYILLRWVLKVGQIVLHLKLFTLQDDAFKPARIREIYMRYCGLTNISPVAFDSLVNSLQILDLSGNNLTKLHHKLFNNFDVLK